jgi:hypothetical protein
MSKVEVNQISSQCGSTLTIGQSGDTVTLACGATQSGFGRTGTVDWDTTAKTASFTAVSGNGYFVNTASGAVTMTLPASPSAGDIVSVADYTRTFATNNLTIGRNSEPIGGVAADAKLTVNGQSATFVYVDSTEGWINIQETQTSQTGISDYIIATGGTEITCGDNKIHVFTGPGTFCVSQAGTPSGSNTVEYLVVAGGGGAGAGQGGGGGAGGFRSFTALPGTNSPLNAPAGLPVPAQAYPITVGGGGTGRLRTPAPATDFNGSNSIFSSITSAGGGGGGTYNPTASARNGAPGGSGGGAGGAHLGGGSLGTGNTPPVSPPQGQPGSANPCTSGGPHMGGGGGGAVTTATNAAGGDGTFIQTGFIGPTAPSYGVTGPAGRYFAGGGAGRPENGPVGEGGLGGGGDAQPTPATGPSTGATNTGGGGGAVDCGACTPGGTGGSGIVIIRYKFQN